MNQRNQFLGVNSIKFHKAFSTDEDCYLYLSELKWDKEYQCKKCGHTKFYKGVRPFSRRCMKCKYDESPTAGTAVVGICNPNSCILSICNAFL